MNYKKGLGNRLLSLLVSLLLLLFSLRYITGFYYLEQISVEAVFFFISGVLYFIASIFLMLEFLNKKVTCVKKHIWLLLYLTGFIPKFIAFLFQMNQRGF